MELAHDPLSASRALASARQRRRLLRRLASLICASRKSATSAREMDPEVQSRGSTSTRYAPVRGPLVGWSDEQLSVEPAPADDPARPCRRRRARGIGRARHYRGVATAAAVAGSEAGDDRCRRCFRGLKPGVRPSVRQAVSEGRVRYALGPGRLLTARLIGTRSTVSLSEIPRLIS